MLKKYFIQLGLEALVSLLKVSIKDEKVKAVVDLLLAGIVKTIDVLTDDDKDNTAQLKELMQRELFQLIQSLVSIGLEVLRDKLTPQQVQALQQIKSV